MLNKVIAIILLAAVGVWAQETRTYLVRRAEYFPDDKFLYTPSPTEYRYFKALGRQNISEAGGQPFRMTSYTISPTGKYAIWSVTFSNENEKNKVDALASTGEVVLLSSASLVGVFNHQRGVVTEMLTEKLADLPTDFFSVDISTP